MISEAVVTNKLESLVAAAIEKTPELARRHLRFETQDGHVTLRGSVATYFQKQVAQEKVRAAAQQKDFVEQLKKLQDKQSEAKPEEKPAAADKK